MDIYTKFNRKLHVVFSNIPMAMGIVGIMMLIWLYIQKNRDKESRLSMNMIIRNTVFVSVLTGIVVYYVKSSSLLEDNMYIRPADF